MNGLREYSYRYAIESRFTPSVNYHFFKLRAVPCCNEFQRLIGQRLEVKPPCHVSVAADSMGNAVQFGGYSDWHDGMTVLSEGRVQCTPYRIADASPDALFLYPTRLTLWDDILRRWAIAHSPGCVADVSPQSRRLLAEGLMHAVHEWVNYQRLVTDNTTSALDVFRGRCGVCQDFAHLMVAACRSIGLHARYVNGLVLGEGETHAWVEVHDGGQWLGYDPTRDCRIEWDYLKIGHGRDVNDCPSNRGRIYGFTKEWMSVCAEVVRTDLVGEE